MQDFVNKGKYKKCISSVQKANENSIEFSLSTQTRRVIKSSQTKSLHICDLCLHTKPSRKPPVGELYYIPILDIQWDTLSIDFIVELPKSFRYNAIMIVVNSMSKRAHFILIHIMVTMEEAARLFLHQVWRLHGLPRYVISDCRSQFIALFTRELY